MEKSSVVWCVTTRRLLTTTKNYLLYVITNGIVTCDFSVMLGYVIGYEHVLFQLMSHGVMIYSDEFSPHRLLHHTSTVSWF